MSFPEQQTKACFSVPPISQVCLVSSSLSIDPDCLYVLYSFLYALAALFFLYSFLVFLVGFCFLVISVKMKRMPDDMFLAMIRCSMKSGKIQ